MALPPLNAGPDGLVALENGVRVAPELSRAQLDLPPSFDADVASYLPAGVTAEQFDALRTVPRELLTAEQVAVVRAVRDAVPLADGDVVQRALTGEHVRNYLANTTVEAGGRKVFDPAGAKGFTARAADVQDLTTPAATIRGLQLEYDDDEYVARNHRAPYDLADDTVAVLRFPVQTASDLHVPYAPELDGQDEWDPPFTGNGFTAGHDVAVPEFLADGFMPLPDGAEVYALDRSGRETLLARFEDGRWFPTVEGASYEHTTTTEDVDADRSAAARRPVRGMGGPDLGGHHGGAPTGLGAGVRRDPGGPAVHADDDGPVGPDAAPGRRPAVPAGDVLPVAGSPVPGRGDDVDRGAEPGLPGPQRDRGPAAGPDEGGARGLRGIGADVGGDRSAAGADRADQRGPGDLTDGASTASAVTGWQPGDDPTGVPRPTVEAGRYLSPGPEVEQRLRTAHDGAVDGDLTAWLGEVNPNARALAEGSPEQEPWVLNCGECARRVADAVQGVAVAPAHGDPQGGEYAEMWAWTGARPVAGLTAEVPPTAAPGAPRPVDDTSRFTADAWRAVSRALAGAPVGTVVVVGVDWQGAGPRGTAGGHWFNAVVTHEGLQWVDGQTGETSPWPPGYSRSIWNIEAVVRRPGGHWEGVDLGRGAADGSGAGGTGQRPGLAEAGTGATGGPHDGLGRVPVPRRSAGVPTDAEPGREHLSGAPRGGATGGLEQAEDGGRRLPGDGGRAGLTGPGAAGQAPERTGPAHGDGPGITGTVGVPRPSVDPGRYLSPGREVEQRLREAYAAAEGAGDIGRWIDAVNPLIHAHEPGSDDAAPWRNNCGECSRRVADAVQGLAADPAWGDERLGEYGEMWAWAGAQPLQAVTAPDPLSAAADDTTAFTAQAWRSVEEALAGQPVGTVAVVGVDWHVPGFPRGEAGGHWFNAVVTPAGLLWVDGQDGTASPWPPGYETSIWRAEAIIRRPGASWEGADLDRGQRTGLDSGGRDRVGAELDGAGRPGDRGPLERASVPGRVGGESADASAGRAVLPGAPRPGAPGAPGAGDVGGRAPAPGGRAGLTAPGAAGRVAERTGPAGGVGPGTKGTVGMARPRVEPERWLDPGQEIREALVRARSSAGSSAGPAAVDGWVPLINPHAADPSLSGAGAVPWTNNCGDCSRRFAEAWLGDAVEPAWGDGNDPPGEYQEMWDWAGARPDSSLIAEDGADHAAFTVEAWSTLGRVLADQPVGTVAVVGADWYDPDLGPDGGHWFNALVTEDGLRWVDAQSGETSGWPPGYTTQVWRVEAIARPPGGEWTGVDLERGRAPRNGAGGDTRAGAGDGARVAGRPEHAGPDGSALAGARLSGRLVGGPGPADPRGLGVPDPPGNGVADPVQRADDGSRVLRGAGGRAGLSLEDGGPPPGPPADGASVERAGHERHPEMLRRAVEQAVAGLDVRAVAERGAADGDLRGADRGAVRDAGLAAPGVPEDLPGVAAPAGVLGDSAAGQRLTDVLAAAGQLPTAAEFDGAERRDRHGTAGDVSAADGRSRAGDVRVRDRSGGHDGPAGPGPAGPRRGAAGRGGPGTPANPGRQGDGPLAARGDLAQGRRDPELTPAAPERPSTGPAPDAVAARRIARPRLVTRLADRALGSLPDVPGVGSATRVEAGHWRVELAGRPLDVAVRTGPTGADVARTVLDVAAGRVEVTLSDRTSSAQVTRAVAGELARAAAVLSGASDLDVLTDAEPPAEGYRARRLSAHDHGRLAELAVLAQRAVGPGGTGRRTEAWIAAEAAALLRSSGLVEGVNDPATGTAVGGSPGFEARFAALPDRSRADVLTLNEIGGLAAVPEAVAGRFATAVKVALGNVVPALMTQAPAVLAAVLTGNLAGLLAPGIAGAAGTAGGVNAGLAERRYARLVARRKAAVENRLGLSAELRGAAATRRSVLLDQLTATAAALAGVRLDLERARNAAPDRPSAGVAGAVLGRLDVETRTPRPAQPLASGLVDDASPTRPGAADRVPAGRSTWARYSTGPVTTFVVGSAGLAIAALCGADVGLLPMLTTGIAAVGSGLLAGAQHRFGLAKAGRETSRSAVEDARAAATSQAQLELAALAEQRALEDAQARVDAAARGDEPPAGSRSVPSAEGDVLVPGPTAGVLEPSRLTAADDARIAQITDLAQQLAGARSADRPALTGQLAAALAAAGLDGRVPVADDGTAESDPDALGWPRRRALLDPDLRALAQRLDVTPSGVPGLGAHAAVSLLGTALPAAATTLAATLGAGFGPLALLTIVGAPVAAALGQAWGQHRSALALETRKTERAAARGGLSDATAARLDDLRADLQAQREELLAQAAHLEADNETLAEGRALRARRADRQARLAAGPAWARTADALFRPGDPVPPTVPEPAAASDAAVPAPAAEPQPVPVPVSTPVHTRWRQAMGTFVSGPTASLVTAFVVWHVHLGQRIDQLVSPATWALAASSPVRTVAAAIAGSAAALVSGAAQASADFLAGRSAAAADEQRKAAVKVRNARLVGPVTAAQTADVARALREATAELSAGRAELAELRERAEATADATVPVRGPGVVPSAVGRVTAWLAGRETAEVRTVAATAPAGSPLHVAALSRLADQLPGAPAAERRELVQVVAGQARRVGMVGSAAPTAGARGPVPGPLGAVVAALGTSGGIATGLTAAGTDEQFWRLMRALANATGWWPEEECDCPPGAPCTCPRQPDPHATGAAAPDRAHPSGAPAPSGGTAASAPSGPPAPSDGTAASAPSGPPAPSDGTAPAPATPAPAGPGAGGAPSSLVPAASGPVPAPSRQSPGPRTDPPFPGSAPDQEPPGSADRPVDVERWPDGGETRSVLVVVRSPAGAEVTVLARLVEPGRGAVPVLVLSDVPGPGMWWGVPAAVLQAVVAALAALRPGPAQPDGLVVLGHRSDGTATGELTQLPVGVHAGVPSVLTGRSPRRLPGEEAVQATVALRLRTVPDLLGRLSRLRRVSLD